MAYQNYYNPYPVQTAQPVQTNQQAQNYQNMYYQQVPATYSGMQQMNYQQPQNNSGFQWVQGEAAARAFHVDPGHTILLMDSDSPVLYLKSTDISGRPTPMIIYDLVERKEQPVNNQNVQNIDLSEYVKRSDIETIIAESVSKAVDEKMGEIKFTATATSSTAKRKAANVDG